MIKNKAQFIKGLETKMAHRPEQNIRRAMAKSGMLVRNEAIDSILRGVKTGEIVTRYNPTREHQVSAEGEAPASDTGRLANSIAHDVIKEGNSFIGRVIASTEYAIHLEFGTNKMGARPFLRPALHESSKKIRNIFMREGIIN
jgi:HK97 gp10 family phage protein